MEYKAIRKTNKFFLLCSERNDTIVKYSILEESKQIFASKYMLYMPTEEELKKEINKDRELLKMEDIIKKK